MKKIISIILVIIFILLTGCTSNTNSYSKEFKLEYESLNGQVNKNGKEHRSLSIELDNPFEKITTQELIKKIENKETFYVYFGDKLCPWCRSVIEKAIEVSKNNKIDKIYYIAIWDDDGNEIVRDKYEIKNNEVVKVVEGCKEYTKFLEYFDEVLSEYNLTDKDGNKITTGEKRIYAPNFIYVKNGKALKLTTGISEKQKDSREDLTIEILKDEEELFNEFFK